MEETIPLHWCLSNNFGDAMNYWLVKKITKIEPIWVPRESSMRKTICIGSILNWADENCDVWGAGLANQTDEVNPGAKIHLTRGPISDKIATECRAKTTGKWGDPALLVPKFYSKEKVDKTYDLGIIPHYIDYHQLSYENYNKMGQFYDPSWYKNVKIINVFDPIEKIIDDITSCNAVISSSLHGLILSDAYSVPNKQITITNLIGGDGTKFYDYFLSVNRKYELPTDFNRISKYSVSELSKCINKEYKHIKLEKIQRTIMSECPFV